MGLQDARPLENPVILESRQVLVSARVYRAISNGSYIGVGPNETDKLSINVDHD